MKPLPKNTYLNYEDLVESFEYKILATVCLGSYQGDLKYLLKDGDGYGYLNIGYGSCSACDALEACGSDHEEITKLRDELHESIMWHPRKEMINFFTVHEWGMDYHGDDPDCQEFVQKSLEALRGNGLEIALEHAVTLKNV